MDTKTRDPDRMPCRMFKKAFSHPPNPARAETRAFPWQGRSERGGEAYRGPVALSDATGDRYVEPPSDARTQLEAFFNILLGRGGNFGELRLLWRGRQGPLHPIAGSGRQTSSRGTILLFQPFGVCPQGRREKAYLVTVSGAQRTDEEMHLELDTLVEREVLVHRRGYQLCHFLT